MRTDTMSTIGKHILLAASKGDVQQLYQYLLDQERTITSLQQQIARQDQVQPASTSTSASSPKQTAVDVAAIRADLQSGGKFPLNVGGLLGRLNEPQDARYVLVTAHPDLLVVTYDVYILAGAPNTIWGINRDVNPPVRFQIV